MTEVWIAIAAMTAVSFAIKAAGPVVLGGRALPPAAERLIALIPAALLTALVVTQTFASHDGRALVLDARAAGIAVAVVAATRRAPMLVVLVLAAGTTALLRLAG
jgi:branched-subunit amino acid transport protein